MSKLFYTCFTKLIIAYFLSYNKNIPRISNSEMHSKGDDLPITKLSNTIEVESEKVKVVEEPEEQNVSPVRSRRGKGYMCSGENETNIPKLFKKNVVPRKQYHLNLLESLKQKKQPVAGEGSSDAHTKYYANSETNNDTILYCSCLDTSEESANETDDADE
ncbi:hypothetical protein Tco_1070137 [Tanacetum coccineum]|uniref:Uncharacterized protein n=1 Tax=Tanacetum coccineum TaxID=301880 RepID=A0ABQ5HKV7_9ASTR